MTRHPMRFAAITAVCCLLIALACPGQPAEAAAAEPGQTALTDRWFFAFGHGRNRQGADQIKALIDTAAAHGLNGMVLSSFGIDSFGRWSDADIALLKEVVDHSAARGIEWIPTGFSVGYGGGALGHDVNFAAALPAVLSLTARGGAIVPEGAGNALRNGSLEEHADHVFPGYAFHDQPGEISFADTDHAADGAASIRFEGFGANPHGHGRLMQRVTVEPRRSYRFALKIRTRDLRPVSGLKAMALRDGREVASQQIAVEPTQDWTEVTLDFISAEGGEIGLYAGIWGGQGGAFWLDDLRFSEYGSLSDIVRREGTPLVLKSRDRERTFEEGKDFEPIRCLRRLDSVRIPEGSSVREGEGLELSCYRIPYVSHSWGRQISLCMSHPPLYGYWAEQARKLHAVVPYKRFLLSMDEIRNGGGCRSCQDRGLSMAEILGDCITSQRAIFQAIDPEIEVMIWSDMLDPAHNARNHYYGVVGDFTGSWEHVPDDLTIMCWYHAIRDESLAFFSGRGFPTFGAAYYDADDLTNPREWLASLRRTPGARGIMYTTWENKYDLLADFGDLVSGADRGE